MQTEEASPIPGFAGKVLSAEKTQSRLAVGPGS